MTQNKFEKFAMLLAGVSFDPSLIRHDA